MKSTIHTGTLNPELSEREKRHAALARSIAADGFVLLKNQGLLPLQKVPIALLGSGAVKPVKGGTGSGDVNCRRTVSIFEGFENAGVTLTSRKWLSDYDSCYAQAREDWKNRILEQAKLMGNCFDAYTDNPFSLPEGRPIEAADLQGAEAAVYVVSRVAGENKDRRLAPGDYYLSPREQADLKMLSDAGLPTVLVVNAGGVVELTDVLDTCPMIRAVLNVSQPGQEAGNAVADVIFGEVTPSGRLTATWPRRYGDIPCSDSFGYLNGDLDKELYREGIFTGYRYFDTFGVKPLFPFGFGLSYTQFETALTEVKTEDGKVFLKIRVKNVGSRPGKEVVQIYASLPQAGLTKESRRLVSFAKTGLLAPGEEETVEAAFCSKALSSFHSDKNCWMVQQGSYGLWVSKNIAEGVLSAVLEVAQDAVTETVHDCFAMTAPMVEFTAPAAAAEREQAWLARAKEAKVPVYPFVPGTVETKTAPKHYAEDYPVEDLLPLLCGNVGISDENLGCAGSRVPGSAGETTMALEEKYGIRSLITADGPAGLRLQQRYEVCRETGKTYALGVYGSLENGFLEPMVHHENADVYYQYCTAFPVGTLIAQTWDADCMEAFGQAVAEEMAEFRVDLWLAPGMNIQRNPLCGRNFEYYSEDPILAGRTAAAVTRGVQSRPGCGVTIKHFACNNQEDNRMGVDCRVSPRALREIYLLGFEIAVRNAAPKAIMTSYNVVNGVHAPNRRDLCTTVPREEWGFDGIIMTDWATTTPDGGSSPWMCAEVGNDLIMPGLPCDVEDIRKAVQSGQLSEEAIRSCAGRMIDLIAEFSK